MEKVIFRALYETENGAKVMAIFPENHFIDFEIAEGLQLVGWFDLYKDKKTVFRGFDGASKEAIYSCRLIKKNDIRIPKLIQAVQNTVGTYYKAYERI